jgi:anti-sigma-K factor RskA
MDRVFSTTEIERSLRAAELSLGLVTGENRDEAGRCDPALAREIARWEEDLARFSDELKPISPSPRAWEALSKTIAKEAVPISPTGAVLQPAARWRDWIDNLWLWRMLAGAGVCAALAALLLLHTPGVQPSQPTQPVARVLLVSALLPRDGPPLYVATYDAARSLVLAVPAATEAAPGRAPLLWLVPKDNKDPIALGHLDPEQPVAVALAPEVARLLDGEAGLVVTLEPEGEPIGPAASGPVIAHGRFTSL